jgi:hypothetical protein
MLFLLSSPHRVNQPLHQIIVLIARGLLVAHVVVSLVLGMQLLAIVLQENQVVFFLPGWGWLYGIL